MTLIFQIIVAHGTIMGLAFVVLFPLGGIIIRFLSPILPVPTVLHYSTQIFTFIGVIAAVGLGIYASIGEQFISFRNTPHPVPQFSDPLDQIFGIIIFVLLVLQIAFGYYHHHRFVRDRPSSRRWFTHAHLWLGRLVILCGIANCGSGLLLAGVDTEYAIIWWVIGCVLAVLYVIASVIAARFRAKRTGEPYGNATGPGYSPERYKRAESYEMNSRGTSPRRV
jgi:hypothetical protein